MYIPSIYRTALVIEIMKGNDKGKQLFESLLKIVGNIKYDYKECPEILRTVLNIPPEFIFVVS